MNDPTEDVLSLIEQNFEFLHVGKFLDEFTKRNDLSKDARTIDVRLENGSTYSLNGKVTSEALHRYSADHGKSSIFGYLIEWNAFRGICMAMKEGMKNSTLLNNFLKQRLGNRHAHFCAILSFIRNVLSHNVQNEIRLCKDDFSRTRNKFMETVSSGIATLTIKYDEDFPEWQRPRNYEFKIEIDFKSLSSNTRFLEVISEWQLYMFSELCFNLAKAFRKENPS